MKNKLENGYTEKEKMDFIVEYNHNQGLRILETEKAIYALEPWESVNESGEIISNLESYELEQKKAEATRIANLKLTKREVFLAIYRDLKITPEEIKKSIANQEALIEFEYANEYYRGNPLIDIIGNSLGYSKKDLDYLFEYKFFPAPKKIVEEGNNA